MPTHASKAQNAQKRTCSLSERVLSASANALTAQTRLLSLACRVREDSLCCPGEGGGIYDVMAVYRSEPSIMEIMNEEKIYPSGSATVGKEAEASCNDGTQTNTNRYIEPSKHVWVKPITNKMGSANICQCICWPLETTFTVAHDSPCLGQPPQLERVDARNCRTASASIVLGPLGLDHEICKDK